MAAILQAIFSPTMLKSTQISLHSYNKKTPHPNVCRSIQESGSTDMLKTSRRSGNYPSTVWNYDHLQSLATNYSEEKESKQLVEKLKNEVKSLISREMEPLAKLELVDNIQRLGLKYHFEQEIEDSLNTIYLNTSLSYDDNLYATALRFRLFRQHGYDQSQDVFTRFKDDESGEFKESLSEDVEGILSLYEASFYGFEGENIIDEAKNFSTKRLMALEASKLGSIGRKIEHALEMPIHWRLNRMEARWYIDTYEQEQDMNHSLFQLAKLDYNMVQSIHQKEVGNLARWWVDLGLNEMFARDSLVECYGWSCGTCFEPKYESLRDIGTKMFCLVTIVDDVYDVYGSLQELQLFTQFVERWDISEIDKFPDIIQKIFLAMYNTSNEIGYWILKEKGFNIIPYLRKQWVKLCNSYIIEAMWYNKGYKPTLEKYMDNASVSIGASMVLFCSYIASADKITTQALDYIDNFPTIIYCSSKIARLANDMGTSSHELARGDTLKSIQLYMHENGVSEEISRRYTEDVVYETWKEMNKLSLDEYPFSEPFLSAILNLARAAQFFYKYGDGHGNSCSHTITHLMQFLLQPIK